MFTQDLKENKKPEIKSIPIELENEYCSHMSPAHQTHIIQAADLHKSGEKNPYNYWVDTERKKSEKNMKPVQKHFYTNYKTNMMRDAHEVAKAVAADMSLEAKQCGHVEKCDCKKVDSPLHRLQLRNQWKSRLEMTRK